MQCTATNIVRIFGVNFTNKRKKRPCGQNNQNNGKFGSIAKRTSLKFDNGSTLFSCPGHLGTMSTHPADRDRHHSTSSGVCQGHQKVEHTPTFSFTDSTDSNQRCVHTWERRCHRRLCSPLPNAPVVRMQLSDQAPCTEHDRGVYPYC